MIEVKADDIKRILQKLLDYQKTMNNEIFQIEHDYYWHISKDKKYNPYQSPEDFTLGQLSWDWENLQDILNGEKDTIGYDLVWLGYILVAIGEEYL